MQSRQARGEGKAREGGVHLLFAGDVSAVLLIHGRRHG